MLCDYHIHSVYSDDAENTMAEMALAAAEAGLSEICFTDHVDLDDIDGNPNPNAWRREEYLAMYRSALEKAGDRIKIKLGAELGEANHFPDSAKAIAAEVPDFIIGSTHNLKNTPDFYLGAHGTALYTSKDACAALLDRYADELIETARLGAFDVIGHIGYPLRYIRVCGYPELDLRPWEARLRELFTILRETGRGVEINTSGLRGTLGETMPAAWLVRLWHDCGGEVITIGSDAHRVSDAGAELAEGQRLARDSGFEYFCTFSEHKPTFIKL